MNYKSDYKHLKNISGIYMFYTKLDPRVYIGSSNNLFRRLQRHYSDLKNNCHGNIHLQRFIIKHGLENLEVKILEFCKVEDLIRIETERIIEYDSLNSGFNMVMPDNTQKSEETKALMSKVRINSKFNKNIQVIINGNIVFEGNINSIKEKYNVDESSVYKIIKGKRKHHKGLSFYCEENKENQEENFKKFSIRKKVFCSTNGILYNNTNEAAEELGLKRGSINHACLYNTPLFGYKFEYKN